MAHISFRQFQQVVHLLLKQTRLFFVLPILILIINVEISYSGEVLDHLPEIQLARTIFIVAELEDLSEGEFSKICNERKIDLQAIDHLWLDAQGNFRSFAKVREILTDISCVLGVSLSSFVLDDEDNSDTDLLFELVSGNTVTTPDGQVIDGNRQAIRSALAFPMAITFIFELFLGNAFEVATPLLGQTPCERLESFVFEGNTLELRWAAFLALSSDLITQLIDGNSDAICSSKREDAAEILLEQARRGDLEAAINLAFLWNQSMESVIESSDDVGISAKIDEISLFLLTHYGEPLVTLAATIALVTLLVGQSEAG